MFPKLKLPPECLEHGLVLAPGPSFDDYRLDDIPDNHPNVFLCGKTFQWKWFPNYVISDTCCWQYAIRHGFPAGLTVWGTKEVLDWFMLLPSEQRPDHFRELLEPPGGLSSTSLLAIHAAFQEHERVYTLGIDGGSSWMGVPRQRVHAMQFTEAYDVGPSIIASTLTASVQHPMLMLLGNGFWDAGKIVNLSTTSCLFHLVAKSEEALSQPWGKVDRYSILVVVCVGKFNPILPIGLSVAQAVHFIRRFQEEQQVRLPQTPIAIISIQEIHSEIVSRLDNKEVLHLPYLSQALRSQFTHVYAIGDWLYGSMPH